MKLNTPEIAWHEKKPILGIDFSKVGSKCRLASAGADNDVKVRIKYIIKNFVLIFHTIQERSSSDPLQSSVHRSG